MVTYGPWIDPPEETERIQVIVEDEGGGEGGGGDLVREGPLSGIFIDWGSPLLATATVGTGDPGPIAVIAPSIDAWDETLLDPMQAGSTAPVARVAHTGAHGLQPGVGDSYVQADTWRYTAAVWDIWQDRGAPAIPLVGGAIDIDWDGPREPITLLGLEINQLVPVIPQWGWQIAPFGDQPGEQGVVAGITPTALRMREGWNGEGGGWVWSADELAHIQALLTPTSAGRLPQSDPRWPVLTLCWVGGYPGYDPVAELAHGPYELTYTATPVFEFLVRFRQQRYRYVYPDDDTPTYRRIYPRGDGLAGGAGRNWPRPKSVQSSSRTSGGYL